MKTHFLASQHAVVGSAGRAARWFAAVLLAYGHVPLLGQSIPDAELSNTGLEGAMKFCSDLSMDYDARTTNNTLCLWFRFDVLDANHPVVLSTSGAPAALMLAGSPSDGGCPDDFAPVMNLSVDQALPVGTHFIVFEWTTNTSITLGIDVAPDGELPNGIQCEDMDCHGCLPSFMPLPQRTYIVSAWTRKEGVSANVVDYGSLVNGRPFVRVSAPSNTLPNVETFYPSLAQPIVEGWQLIEGEIKTDAQVNDFNITLGVESGTALFDDVRVFPKAGSMKCYVYDPENLRFTAELDERHFATFYEYDNEGKLVRVKKETERGIMTIQESRQNSSHH
jgi:hypothetical protein